MIAVLGAGPHGREIAHLLRAKLYDDNLPGYEPTIVGAEVPWVVGAVWPDVRRHIATQAHIRPPYHRGVVVFPHTYIGQDVELGDHVHILPGAVVSHGCRLGEFVTVATGANLCGEVTVEPGAFIGAGATVIHGGITIGAGAMVGAGVTVRHDVPAAAVLRCSA